MKQSTGVDALDRTRTGKEDQLLFQKDKLGP